MKKTLTEECKITAKKVFEILGNSQIRELHYAFTDGEIEKISWIDTDEFRYEVKSGWNRHFEESEL